MTRITKQLSFALRLAVLFVQEAEIRYQVEGLIKGKWSKRCFDPKSPHATLAGAQREIAKELRHKFQDAEDYRVVEVIVLRRVVDHVCKTRSGDEQVACDDKKCPKKPAKKREWHGCTNPKGHYLVEGRCTERGCKMDLRIASEKKGKS